MGKLKVNELAKELNISNTDIVSNLKNIGIDVDTHLSVLTEEQYDKAKRTLGEKKEEQKTKTSSTTNTSPHIIRRQIKVINTSGDKDTVEEITTNLTGDIQKSHHTMYDNKKEESYSKEGLGVVTPRQQEYNNRPKFQGNRNSNIVITRNGKPVEKPQNEAEEIVKDDIKVEQENMVQPETAKQTVEEEKIVKQPETTTNNVTRTGYNNNENSGYRNNNTGYNNSGYRGNNNYNNNGAPNAGGNTGYRSNNPGGNSTGYNNSGYRGNNNYNNNGTPNTSGNTGYRSNNPGGNGTGYNSGYRGNNNYNNNGAPNAGGNTGYRSNNPGGNSTGYNNSGYRGNNNYNNNGAPNNGGNTGYRSNNGGGYNNNNTGYNRGPGSNTGYNRGPGGNSTGYNNSGYRSNNGGGYNNNFGNRNMDNTSYQVNKFIKNAQPTDQKDARDYSSTLIDKKKVNNYSTADGKKEKINKNELREQHSRVATSQLKGLELNTSGELIDLYVRDTDFVRKNAVRRKAQKPRNMYEQTKIIPMTEVKLPDSMTVKEFAEAIKKQASEIIKKLFALGIMATVNNEIDFDTAFLIAAEFGITAEKQVIVTDEDKLFDDSEDSEENLVARPPIVVVMGHVDHGKTSLLDKIRSANVVSKEAGGITQHIGAYKVEINNREICFLDTPGHEAFTQMRARGAHITDIAIIVVAADDGIKPQTIEAIDHAKAAGVSIIVAINKIDKPAANIDRVKQELLEVGLVSEEWGGDTICVPISALTGEGIENLLEMILLVADMKDLKTNPDKQAKGTVLEAKLDKNVGTMVSMLVQRGTLNVGDTIVVGDIVGKVRAMKDDKGKKVKLAGPSTPVEIIGLPEVPQTGDIFYEVKDERTAKHLVDSRKASARVNLIKQGSKVTLNDVFNQIKEGSIKDLNVIIKADVQGSVEALKDSLEKLSNEEVRVKIIHASTGAIKESDVTLASVSNAIIIGFNVRPENLATIQADKEKVDLRLYRVIYDAINDVSTALKGMLAPTYKEVIHGECEVRQLFKVTNVGTIAGCHVKKGKIIRNEMARVIRDSIVIFEGKIESLKREKDDAKEVAEGYECGVKFEKYNDMKEGDIIECFEMQEVKKV